MPNIGFGELMVILLVALLVFGPRKLPEIGRTVGKTVREFRRATTNLRDEFERGIDEDPPFAESPWDGKRAEHEAKTASPNGDSSADIEQASSSTAEGEAEPSTGDTDPD